MALIEIKSNLDKVNSELDEKIVRALTECGMLAEGYAKVNLTESGAVDTGALRNSISFKVKDDTLYVGTNMEYAPYVEFGTGIYYQGGRPTPWIFTDAKGNTYLTHGMKPRPYLKPAIANHVKEYQSVIQDALKK